MRISAATLAVLCACLLGGSGCAKKTGAPAESTNALAIAVPQEPASLNPLLLEGIAGYMVSELGYSYLTNYDSAGNVVPDLAANVPTTSNGGIAPDGTRVTFHLRRGVVWQDGAPVTARDVAFTFRAIMNPDNAIPSRYGYDRVAGVDVPDPLTAVVRLKRPYAPIIAYFFGGDSNYPILPAHLLDRYTNLNRVAFNAAPVGSGPYHFARWARGDRLTLSANPHYYAGRPAIDRIALRFVPSSSTTIDQLATGEVDATFFADVSRIASLRAIPNHRILVTPVPYFYALPFNLTDPIVKDIAVRRAFALAIDRRTLVDKVSHGLYDADTGMRGLFTWAFDPHVGAVPYDPRAAAALLARDGWAAGPDGIRTKNGQRLELQLSFYAGSDIEAEFVPLIVEQERAAGIDVTTKRYSRDIFMTLGGPLNLGRFQVALYSYQSSYDPDASWLLACSQRAPSGFNDARYCNPAVDAALERGIASFDPSVRKRAYAFVQRTILNDLPYDFLCQVSEVDVIPARLHGYERPLLSPFNSVARWVEGFPSPRR